MTDNTTLIPAKLDTLMLNDDKIKALSNRQLNIEVSDTFKEELLDYCKDHIKHFKYPPLEFQYGNYVVDYDDFKHLIPEEIFELIPEYLPN